MSDTLFADLHLTHPTSSSLASVGEKEWGIVANKIGERLQELLVIVTLVAIGIIDNFNSNLCVVSPQTDKKQPCHPGERYDFTSR